MVDHTGARLAQPDSTVKRPERQVAGHASAQRPSALTLIPRSPAICRCLRPLVCKRRTASSLKARSNRRPLFPFCFDICTSCDQNPIAGRLHFRQQGPSSPSASTGGSTRSTPSAHCSASRATPLLQPMPSFTRESGGTQHVAVMGVNRIGKKYFSGNFLRPKTLISLRRLHKVELANLQSAMA